MHPTKSWRMIGMNPWSPFLYTLPFLYHGLQSPCVLSYFLLTAIYHLRTTVRWFRSSEQGQNKLPLYLTAALFLNDFIYFLIAIHMTYTETYPVTLSECQIVKYTTTVSYTAFKMWTYIILVSRVWAVFSDPISPVHYSKAVLIVWIVVIVGMTVSTNSINALTTRVTIDSSGQCAYEWGLLFMGSVASHEVMAGIVFLYCDTQRVHAHLTANSVLYDV